MELGNRVAVVTGGGNGIGAALCRRFAGEGAQVVVADLNADAAERVAAEIGGTAASVDVANEEAVTGFVKDTLSRSGRIDLFCHNAGIATVGDIHEPTEVWQRSWDVNVMAHVYATRAVLPSMLARGEGYLLHTASAAGLLTNLGAAPYSVTKHAVVALAEWLSVTYGDQGIRVSCLCPQFVSTDMLPTFTALPGMSDFATKLAIDADTVAGMVVDGLRAERFLILPHPEVEEYFRRKGSDYERWLSGMRRLQRTNLASG